jgi:hypothetical protein
MSAPVTWEDLEAAAPEIARLGRERLDRTRVGLLGTIRKDGSPRISPVEPYFTQGHLLFGAMAWSRKVRDLQQDPRCLLHSAISAPDTGEDELKLYGRATPAGEWLRQSCGGAWWSGRSQESAIIFSLSIQEATLVSWDLQSGELTARYWSRTAGLRTTRRSYP